VNQLRRFAGCTNLQLLCKLDQHQTCLSGTCSHLHKADSVYKPRCCIQCALLQQHHCLHDMSTHRRSVDRNSAECSRSEAALCSEIMCYSCDSTEHLANDLACPKTAPRSRAAMQQRAETLDDALIRELLELRAERAHLHKISSRAQVQEQCDGVGEETGVVTSAAKVNRCSGDKLATTYACIAAYSLTSHPSLAHSVSGAVKMRAERTHLRNLSNGAKAEEECDGEIKEYDVATSAAKAHRCSRVKLATMMCKMFIY